MQSVPEFMQPNFYATLKDADKQLLVENLQKVEEEQKQVRL